MIKPMKTLYIFALMVLSITILISCNQTQASPADVPGSNTSTSQGETLKVYESADQTLTFKYPSYLNLEGPDLLQSADWTNQIVSDKSFKIDVQISENESNMTLNDFLGGGELKDAKISDPTINGKKFKLQKGLLTNFGDSPFYCIVTLHNGKFYSLIAYSTTIKAEKNIEEIFNSIVIH